MLFGTKSRAAKLLWQQASTAHSEKDFMQILTKAIIRDRAELGLSQRQMAKKLGVSQSYLTKVERGEKPPSYHLLYKVGRLTGKTFLQSDSPAGLAIGSWILTYDTMTNPEKIAMEHFNFSELSTEQRTYLRNKWSVEVKELSDEIDQQRSKLAKRLQKLDVSESELALLDKELSDARSVLDALTAASMDETVIQIQQAAVSQAEAARSEFLQKGGLLSDEEVILQQMEIHDLEAKRAVRAQRIAELDAGTEA